MPKPERSDKIRRRPKVVRYFYLAVGKNKLHTGMSLGGLKYVLNTDGIEQLYLADLVTGKVNLIYDEITVFMDKWRLHYNNPAWDYFAEKGGSS